MLLVGLSGGFACGKSFVADEFAKLGAHILDTDLIARELVEPGNACLEAIQQRYGDSILNADGGLDRAGLRRIILTDSLEKAWLEGLLHPAIHEVLRVRSAIIRQTDPSAIVMQVIPLLCEKPGARNLDRILIVDCDPEQQMQRARDRGNWSESEIRAVIASQCTREARLQLADDVLDNRGSPEQAMARIRALMDQYQILASARPSCPGNP